MGKKAIIGGLLSGGAGFVFAKLIENPVTYLVHDPIVNPYTAGLFKFGIESLLTLGLGLGAYKDLRKWEKKHEYFDKLEKEIEERKSPEIEKVSQEELLSRKDITSKLVSTEKALHSPPVIEKKGEEYRMGDVSGETEKEAVSKYFMRLTGGKSRVTPIRGRESLFMQDLMAGRYAEWESFLSKNPEVRDKSSEVQATLFEREILGKKVVKKRVA